jgi:S-adenosylmethionine synthetase
MSRPVFTSQSVAEKHPDRTAERIGDTVLEALPREDPTADGVGVEGPCAPDHHRY